MACGLNETTLPDSARKAAQINLFDTLACAVAGSSAAAVAETRELVTEWGGRPQAGVWVFGDRVPAHHAAWLNGTMAHARDYDDTHDAAVLHAGVSVVPAALAAAELMGGVSGQELLCAVAAGLETICRLGMGTRITIVESGFMYTPLLGYFAATVAAARVMRFDEAQTQNALGIVYSQVAGNHQVTRDGALTKRMQPGFAAMSALVSVQLARKGVRGAQHSFDGSDGFFRVYLRDRIDRSALTEGLGERFEFEHLSYKPYPCCRFNHNPIGAALALRAQVGDVARIRRVQVGVNHQAYEAVCTPIEVRKAPKTVVLAQFSIPYTVAAALIDGDVGLSHFSPESLLRPDLLALARKIEGHMDPIIERDAGRSVSPADLRIEFTDGQVLQHRMDVPLGHYQQPMSESDFDRKAEDCFRHTAKPLHPNAAHHLRQWVNDLTTIPRTGSLYPVLNSAEEAP